MNQNIIMNSVKRGNLKEAFLIYLKVVIELYYED